MGKVAVVTGATGQDGSYLIELLLEKGYSIHAIVRRVSAGIQSKSRIKHLLGHESLSIHDGDLSDSASLVECLNDIGADEFYNLGAQSFVPHSWKSPVHTLDITGAGTLRCLEAIRLTNPETKFYQAGSSEQFGMVQEIPQTETTPFYPRSPYGCSKVYSYHITKNYRESYGMFCTNGILFNHESPRRGLEFVTRKVTNCVAQIALGKSTKFTIGNMDAKRDWGYARDYMEGIWSLMQLDTPEDVILATNKTWSVRSLIEIAFSNIEMDITWEGEGVEEKGYCADGVLRVEVDEKLFRPAEVDLLIGDFSKANRLTGWEPKTSFEELIRIMVLNDLEQERNSLL